MSSQTLYRWSGIVLLVGSLLGVIGILVDNVLYFGANPTPQQTLSLPFALDSSLFLAWALLLTMGLPGLYLRQSARAGKLGFAGFVLLLVGMLLAGVGFAIVQLTIYPYLAQSAPKLIPSSNGTGPLIGSLLWWVVPGLSLAVGNILLGIATVRSRVFPRFAGILLMVAAVVSILGSFPIPFSDIMTLASNLVLFVAFAGFGFTLVVREKQSSVGAEPSLFVAKSGQ